MKKTYLKKIIGITVVLLLLGTGFTSVSADPLEPDTEPPVITNANVTPNTQTRIDNVNISCTVTDNIAVDLVLANITYPDDTKQNITMMYNNITNLAYLNQTYNQLGIYYLHIWANDTSNNQNTTNQLQFEIINQVPNKPSNPTPANNSMDIPLTTILSWQGNDPDGDDLTYTVYFGTDQNPPVVSPNQANTTYDPELEELTTYYWYITASDGMGGTAIGPLWKFTTGTSGSGNITLNITNPAEPGFYIGGQKIINLPNTYFIYGGITITVEANAPSGIDKVEFFVGNTKRGQDKTPPYEYNFRKLISGPTTIRIVVTDNDNQTKEETLRVFKWRIHPVLILAGTYGSFKAVQRVIQGKPIIGWTIVRGIVLNVKEQGNEIIFRAVRLHYTEITAAKSSTGVIRGKRVKISDVGLNRMLTIGPFGSISYVFAISYGELKELT